MKPNVFMPHFHPHIFTGRVYLRCTVITTVGLITILGRPRAADGPTLFRCILLERGSTGWRPASHSHKLASGFTVQNNEGESET